MRQGTTGGLRRRAAAVTVAVIAATAGAASGGVVLVPVAQAGQYTVDACQHPDNATAPTDGWAAAESGSPYTYYENACSSGSGLNLSFDPAVAHDYGTQANWSVSAPPNTTLASITALRASAAGQSQPYGTPAALLYTNQAVLESCSQFSGCTGLNGPVTVGLDDAATFSAAVQCGGGPGGSCPASNTGMSLRRIALTLTDAASPQFTLAPSGSLMSSSTTTRSRTLTFSASDAGSGIYRQQLIADGATTVHTSVVDANGGKCDTYGSTGHFSYLRPCKLSASGTITLDTSSLSDGQHDLTLQVLDAAGNAVSYGPFPITVDNRPPVVGTPTLSGTATVGQTLTCSATVSGQSPTTSYTWFRTAPDGSDETQIPGANASTYTLSAAEQGKKVLCAVTGTDAGGSASARTTLTTPPFNGGATVAPASPSAGTSGTGGTGAAAASGASGASAGGTGGVSTGSSGPVTTAAGGAGAGAAAREASAADNGTNAGLAATVTAAWLTNGRTTLTDRYNGSPTLRGRVVNAANGQPIGGAILDVIVTPASTGARPLTKTGLRTTADGKFTLKQPLGVSSRTLQIVYRPTLNGAAAGGRAVLNLVVRAGLSLTRITAHTGRLVLSGRLAGGPFPTLGPVVEIQVKKGRAWQLFGSGRADARGHFTIAYQPAGSLPRGVQFTFRAQVRADDKYPYAAGISKPRRAVIR